MEVETETEAAVVVTMRTTETAETVKEAAEMAQTEQIKGTDGERMMFDDGGTGTEVTAEGF
jgi:hypothetical protein